jgi:hypothetical protein
LTPLPIPCLTGGVGGRGSGAAGGWWYGSSGWPGWLISTPFCTPPYSTREERGRGWGMGSAGAQRVSLLRKAESILKSWEQTERAESRLREVRVLEFLAKFTFFIDYNSKFVLLWLWVAPSFYKASSLRRRWYANQCLHNQNQWFCKEIVPISTHVANVPYLIVMTKKR